MPEQDIRIPIVRLAAQLAAYVAAAQERARALARWENEGGAAPAVNRALRDCGPRATARRAPRPRVRTLRGGGSARAS